MSTSRDSCCLPSVKKQKHDFQVFGFVQCIIKQLLDSVSVISRIIKVEVRVISRSRRLRLITLTSTLIILDITKTSSNNCLICVHEFFFRYKYACRIPFSKSPTRPLQNSNGLALAPVVQRLDNAIHWINRYPVTIQWINLALSKNNPGSQVWRPGYLVASTTSCRLSCKHQK